MRVQVRKRPRIASTSTSAGCEVRRGLGVPRLPAFEAGERVFFSLRAPDLDQRMLGHAPPGRLHARRLAGLLPVMRRPRRIAQSVALVPRRQLEQALERAGLLVDARVPVADPQRTAPASWPA